MDSRDIQVLQKINDHMLLCLLIAKAAKLLMIFKLIRCGSRLAFQLNADRRAG